MSTEIEKIFKEINAKLSVLINLSLEDKPDTIKGRIELLSKLGVSNKDIAKILNISEKHVSKEKSLIKKRSDKNG